MRHGSGRPGTGGGASRARALPARRRRGGVVAAVAALSLAGPGLPAGAQVAAVAGAGSRTCAQMRADIAELPNVRRAYLSWMQGYLSGRNAAREAEGQALVDLADYEAQWAWIAAWCGAHTERSFAEAVSGLFAERAGLTDGP